EVGEQGGSEVGGAAQRRRRDRSRRPAARDVDRRPRTAGLGRAPDPPRMSGFTAPHCGSLRASDEGHEVELYGWVARRRDHGAVTFIDLRDRWGLVQVVI